MAYTLPSLPELFGQPSYDSFNSHFIGNNEDEGINFELKVQNTADSTVVECNNGSEHKCKVNYRLRYTPLLQDILPSNVYHDQQLTLMINPMGTQYSTVIKEDAEPVDFIKFSGTRCDSEDLFNNEKRLSSFTVDDLPTRSGDQKPGN